MKRHLIILYMCACALTGFAQDVLQQWQAGECVSLEEVNDYGLDNCFVADTLSDEVFGRMKGKSFPKACTTKRHALRYVRVLHYDGEGKIRLGELVCNEKIADDLTDIFQKLFEAKYPIERMVLIDNYNADDEKSMQANNTSSFCFRTVDGSKKLSKHAQGMAIDINPLYNPMVKRRSNGTLQIQPATGMKYAIRQSDFPYKIDENDLCYKLFTAHGFTWGGSWRSMKDYQHFEK